MSWRKNVFSYLLWAFYTIIVGTLMVGIGNIFCGDRDLPSYSGAVFAVILTAALGGVAFLLRCFTPKLTVYAQIKACLVTEALILTFLLVLGALFRMAAFQGVEEAAVYYEMAEVTMGQDVPQIAHGAVQVYVWILHLVFLFLGNHFVVGIMAQMIFQGIAVLLLYHQIRKYIGSIAALAAAGFLTCAPYMVQRGLTLSPDMVYLCLLAAAGAVTAAFCGHGIGDGDGTAGRKSRLPFFLLAGIVSAVMTYLDVAGALLLLFSIGMVFCSQNHGSQNFGSQNVGLGRQPSGRGRKALSCLFCVLGFVLGFAGCAMADSLAGGKSFVSVLQVWFQLYRPKNFQMPAVVGMSDSRVESLVLIGLMTLGIYSFWFERKRERLAIHMSASCAVIFAGCFGIFTPEMPGTLFLYLLFVIMAGIGLQQCFSGGEALKIQPERAEGAVQEAAASFETPVEKKTNRKDRRKLKYRKNPGDLEDPETWEDQGNREKQELREKQDDMKNSENQIGQGRQEVQEQTENKPDALVDKDPAEKKEKKEIRYLENPLPLPKKHEKKVLDYDYPVADDDDFDI